MENIRVFISNLGYKIYVKKRVWDKPIFDRKTECCEFSREEFNRSVLERARGFSKELLSAYL
jgi:hypothetical protein